MSSIMSMDEVSFSNSNINNIFVSKWQQWIQGSDYDIDKDYILSYNFTDDGKFINWSPLFKINDKRLFDESLNLPLPTNKKLIIEENNNFDEYANILIHDYIDLSYDNINDLIEKYGIINISTDLDINKEIIKLVIINKLLTRISKVGKLIINPNDKEEKTIYPIVGNQNPTEAPAEIDSAKGEDVAVMPPFGARHVYYYVLGIVVAGVLVVGIVLIKKKVLKK